MTGSECSHNSIIVLIYHMPKEPTSTGTAVMVRKRDVSVKRVRISQLLRRIINLAAFVNTVTHRKIMVVRKKKWNEFLYGC